MALNEPDDLVPGFWDWLGVALLWVCLVVAFLWTVRWMFGGRWAW